MTLRKCHTFPFKLDLGIRKNSFQSWKMFNFNITFSRLNVFQKNEFAFLQYSKNIPDKNATR